jgi:hypothetical protein
MLGNVKTNIIILVKHQNAPLMLNCNSFKEKTKHLRWRNMSIVTIVGERTNQFYTWDGTGTLMVDRTGNYPVLSGFLGILANLENRRQTGGLIGSIGELYNEIEKSIQAGFQKETLLKDSKLEIWMKKL